MKKEMFEKHYDALRVQKQLNSHTSQLADIGTFPATNITVNGNFDDLDNWNVISGNATLSDNIISLTASAQHGRIEQVVPLIQGHKYYASAWVNVGADGVILWIGDNVYFSNTIASAIGTGAYEHLRGIVDITTAVNAPTANLSIRDLRTSNFTVIEISRVMLLDLTAIFGAGNEPTAAQMDALLARWPNSWFDGTVNLAQCDYFTLYLIDEIRKLRAAVTTLGGTL